MSTVKKITKSILHPTPTKKKMVVVPKKKKQSVSIEEILDVQENGETVTEQVDVEPEPIPFTEAMDQEEEIIVPKTPPNAPEEEQEIEMHKQAVEEAEETEHGTDTDVVREETNEEEVNEEETHEDKKQKTKKPKPKRKTISARSNITFPVRRGIGILKRWLPKQIIRVSAGIYISAVLEYLIAEICELAGQFIADKQKMKTIGHYGTAQRISPFALYRAIMEDDQFAQMFSKIQVRGGGIQIFMNAELTNQLRTFRKKISGLSSEVIKDYRQKIRDLEKQKKDHTDAANIKVIRASYSEDPKDYGSVVKYFASPLLPTKKTKDRNAD